MADVTLEQAIEELTVVAKMALGIGKGGADTGWKVMLVLDELARLREERDALLETTKAAEGNAFVGEIAEVCAGILGDGAVNMPVKDLAALNRENSLMRQAVQEVARLREELAARKADRWAGFELAELTLLYVSLYDRAINDPRMCKLLDECGEERIRREGEQ